MNGYPQLDILNFFIGDILKIKKKENRYFKN